MNSRSRSTLFLMEQLIVVAIFAISAAACVRILAASYFTATESNDLSNAIHAAESAAESYKAVMGDINKTAEILNGNAVSIEGRDAVIVYYDKDWRVSGHSDANFALRLVESSSANKPAGLMSGELTVEKLTGEEIIAFPVAVAASVPPDGGVG